MAGKREPGVLLDAGNALDPLRSRRPNPADLIECCFHVNFKAVLIWLKDQYTAYFKKQKEGRERRKTLFGSELK